MQPDLLIVAIKLFPLAVTLFSVAMAVAVSLGTIVAKATVDSGVFLTTL